MDEHAVAWEHTTHSFGEPYGAQRGCVEVSLCGPDDALVTVECAGRTIRVRLGELAERLARGPVVPDAGARRGLPGELALQTAVGALLGLGVRALDVEFDDPEFHDREFHDPELDGPGSSPGATFYYARAFQVDGELAWSSPIWVQPPA
jgi:hypothetical protein